MFSSRLPSPLVENALSRAVRTAEAAGAHLLDLTETNPTVVGLPYPPDLPRLLDIPDTVRYAPDPTGLVAAREAVAASLPGAPVTPGDLILTSSTSEAYALLFKL